MGYWQKLTAFLLPLLLALLPLAACAPKDTGLDEDTVMGRYLEEPWTLPVTEEGGNVNISAVHKLPDGSIGAIVWVYATIPEEEEVDMDNYPEPERFYYTTTDGESWQEETPAWLDPLMEKTDYLNNLHFNSKGEGVAVYYPKTDDEEMAYSTMEIAVIDPDGTVTATTIGADGTPWEDPYQDMYWSQDEEAMDGEDDEADGDGAANDNVNDRPDQTEDDGEDEDGLSVTANVARSSMYSDSFTPDNEEEAADGEDGEEDGEDEPAGFYYGRRDPDEPEPLYVRDAVMGEDGMIYISDYSNVGRFDPATGEMVQDYLTWHQGFALSGDEIALVFSENSYYGDELDLDGTTIVFLDTVTGDETRRVPAADLDSPSVNGRYGRNEMKLWGEASGDIYIAGTAGLFHLASGGEELELLLLGGMSSLSMPSMWLNTFLPHGDGEFLFHYAGEDVQLINTVFSPDTPARPDQELVIYSLVSDDALPQAVGVFRKENPDVLVTIVQASRDDEDAATRDDFIRALNTELLAGKGPDLLLLDDMPIDSYVEKGVLADLSDIIQPMVDSGELLGSVATALEQDGKVYAVPTRFSVPTLWGEKAALEAAGSFSDLVDYAEAHPEQPLFGSNVHYGFLLTLSRMYQSLLLDDSGQVNADALEQFYTDCKRLMDLQDEDHEIYEYDMTLHSYTWEYRNMGLGSSAMDLAYGEVDLSLEILSGYQSLLMPNGAMYKRNGGVVTSDFHDTGTTVPDDQVTEVYRLMTAGEGEVFFPSSIIGVNAAGQQELAKSFVRNMISTDAQEYDGESGFPINTGTLNSMIEKETHYISMVSMEGGYDDVPERQLEGSWPSEAMLRAVESSLSDLKVAILDNRDFVEIVYNEFGGLLKGDTTPQEAAESVVQKSMLMLAE